MKYSDFINELSAYAEEDFAAFQKKLIIFPGEKRRILGIRTPTMRKLAKAHLKDADELMSFPEDVYEVTFIALSAVALLPYDDFVRYIDRAVRKIDNWATCDSFKAKCIEQHKEDFLPYIEKFFEAGTEFSERYALTTLLAFYTEEKYLPLIRRTLQEADTRMYYVHMAAAWLTAEVIVRHFDAGVSLLKDRILTPQTHNKAIQKARESYRLTAAQKEFLNTLKIK